MIRYADLQDLAVLQGHDGHISGSELKKILAAGRVLVLYQGETFIGWLRFGFFWDSIPFINMLFILDAYRGQGNGTRLVSFWEKEMARAGHRQVLTSTQANERAQFFYRKLGYVECGALLLPQEPLEMFFRKDLAED